MLNRFVAAHRDRIVRAAEKLVRRRGAPAATAAELEGLPIFVDQLAAQLAAREGRSPEAGPDIGPTAARHGERLYRLGVGTTQLVHDYAAVSRAIMAVAIDEGASIPSDEFRLLDVCLDEAIAQALSAHGAAGVAAGEQAREREEAEHLGVLVHELRNALSAVVMGFGALKRAGAVPEGSRVGAIIERNLGRLSSLIDQSLADARLRTAPELRLETFTLGALVDEVEGPAAAQAEALGLNLAVEVEPPLAEIRADRQLVVSALSNLVRNAIERTRSGGTVTVRARAEGDRARLEVEDECGGLPAGTAERLFPPFVQGAANRRGVSLGLAIVQRAVEAHGGRVGVRDKAGAGCVFFIELPRAPSGR